MGKQHKIKRHPNFKRIKAERLMEAQKAIEPLLQQIKEETDGQRMGRTKRETDRGVRRDGQFN
jgi:hypothetical protein